MCLERRQLSRKARIFLALGNLCLVAGLSLSLFNNTLGAQHANSLDFFRGMTIGLAITFLFFAARLSRRQPPLTR